MDEVYFAEAVFRIIKERRQGIQDLLIYDNEYYRYTLGIIVSASFGTRAATKFFGKK